jgi:hypothetical protein
MPMDEEQFMDSPSKTIRLKTDLLFTGSAFEVEEFIGIAEKCVSLVNEATSVRLIVLETWLFVDYSMRQVLMSALELSRFNHEEYDLRYNLLSRSFEGCLNLLLKLKKVNEELAPNPENNRLTYPARLLFFLRREHKEFFDKLLEVEKEYYQKYFPALIPKEADIYTVVSEPKIVPVNNNYRRLSDGWLKSVAKIDDDWGKKAAKLNGARNLAAHSYDERKIAGRLGYTGEHALEHVKKHCLELLEQMIGIVPKAEDASADIST